MLEWAHIHYWVTEFGALWAQNWLIRAQMLGQAGAIGYPRYSTSTLWVSNAIPSLSAIPSVDCRLEQWFAFNNQHTIFVVSHCKLLIHTHLFKIGTFELWFLFLFSTYKLIYYLFPFLRGTQGFSLLLINIFKWTYKPYLYSHLCSRAPLKQSILSDT